MSEVPCFCCGEVMRDLRAARGPFLYVPEDLVVLTCERCSWKIDLAPALYLAQGVRKLTERELRELATGTR